MDHNTVYLLLKEHDMQDIHGVVDDTDYRASAVGCVSVVRVRDFRISEN